MKMQNPRRNRTAQPHLPTRSRSPMRSLPVPRADTRSLLPCRRQQHHRQDPRSTLLQRRTSLLRLAKASTRHSTSPRCIARRTTGYNPARREQATADRRSGLSAATRTGTWTPIWKLLYWVKTPNQQLDSVRATRHPRQSPRRHRNGDQTASLDQARPGARVSRSESCPVLPPRRGERR